MSVVMDSKIGEYNAGTCTSIFVVYFLVDEQRPEKYLLHAFMTTTFPFSELEIFTSAGGCLILCTHSC